jgi:hypothetical protein
VDAVVVASQQLVEGSAIARLCGRDQAPIVNAVDLPDACRAYRPPVSGSARKQVARLAELINRG